MEKFLMHRSQYAQGNGGLPIVGDPDYVAAQLADLAKAGLTGIAVSLVNYADELPYFADEVIGRLERMGLREKVRNSSSFRFTGEDKSPPAHDRVAALLVVAVDGDALPDAIDVIRIAPREGIGGGAILGVDHENTADRCLAVIGDQGAGRHHVDGVVA